MTILILVLWENMFIFDILSETLLCLFLLLELGLYQGKFDILALFISYQFAPCLTLQIPVTFDQTQLCFKLFYINFFWLCSYCFMIHPKKDHYGVKISFFSCT